VRNTPERGDFIWIDFTPQAGHEQGGRRPALVLSPAFYNSAARLCLCCPITSKSKGYPFEIQIPEGLPVSGVILADQVRSFDWSIREFETISAAPSDLLQATLEKVKTLLDG